MMASACASGPAIPVNQPLTAPAPAEQADLGVDGDAIMLALSGGGARAASFSYGALLALRDMPAAQGGRLIDRVALVTSVSGGSITAAWFGLHGPDDLDGFRAAALDKDWAGDLNAVWAPTSWANALGGGINGPGKLSAWLDREIFAGAKLSDLRAGPRIIINATEIYDAVPFAFAAPWFDAICSDLGSVRVADAVAASMAVPLAFRPVVAATHGKDCPTALPAWVHEAADDHTGSLVLRETAKAFESYRAPDGMKLLSLADGGVYDNFGLSGFVTLRAASGTAYGPFSARDAVKVRRLTVLVVNAEMSPSGKYPMGPKGPSGADVLGAWIDDSIDAAKRNAYDAFAAQLHEWERGVIAWRCALPAAEAARLGAGPGWDCRDVHVAIDTVEFADLPKDQFDVLSRAPTRVSLPPDLIDALIAGGRRAMRENPTLKALAE
jgi:predicted acylesterase/phospholipase RssA